jgi:hypothetical protein
MTRRIVNHTRTSAFRSRSRSSADLEYPGACTCRQFSGGRAVHNYGQPGCRYAQLDDSASTY